MHINHDKKLVYIPIDKCASSVVKKYLENMQNFVKNTSSKKLFFGYKYFTIIRNPKDRWISGLTQYIFNEMKICYKKFHYENIKFVVDDKKYYEYFNKFDTYLKNSEELVFQYVEKKLSKNKFIFDSHTKPQSSTINPILIVDSSYNEFEFLLLKLDNNLSKKIGSIFGEHEIDLLCFNKYNRPDNNNTSESVYKRGILPKCQEYYFKFCENNEEFYNLYLDDYELFNRAI
jgi:hypothetical protein